MFHEETATLHCGGRADSHRLANYTLARNFSLKADAGRAEGGLTVVVGRLMGRLRLWPEICDRVPNLIRQSVLEISIHPINNPGEGGVSGGLREEEEEEEEEAYSTADGMMRQTLP